MPPAISVLVPIRGAGEHLPLALDSLGAQSEADYEALLVDDGASDAVRAELERRARADRRLRVLRCAGSGLVAALNTGLAAAQAPLLARFDADDWMHPERLSRQRAHFAVHPALALSATRFHLLDAVPGGGYERYRDWQNGLLEGEAIHRARFIESPLAHPTICIRTELLRSLGGYRELDWPEDYDLFLRLLEGGHRVEKLAEDLHGWRDHPQRTSRVDPRYAPEAFLRLKAHFLARGVLAQRARTWIWGAGPIGTRLYRALRAEGASIAGFIDIDPKKIGSTRGGLRIHAQEVLSAERGSLILAAVGGSGAAVLRAHLAAIGYAEGADFLAVA
ncbi:MAG: glycosyltransferase [Planctomycetes bacterium]|nr:glycosyltransferase [Planctomycetota bacterium]